MRKTYISDSSDDEEHKLDNTSDRKYKILVLGDKSVGKTSFITRLTRGYFSILYTATKTIEIHREVKIGDMLVTLWDIPPGIKYHMKLESLGAHAVILMFNTEEPLSYKNVINTWEHMVKDVKRIPYVFIVGVRKSKNTQYVGSYFIDNMSTDGYHELLYAIQTILASH